MQETKEAVALQVGAVFAWDALSLCSATSGYVVLVVVAQDLMVKMVQVGEDLVGESVAAAHVAVDGSGGQER